MWIFDRSCGLFSAIRSAGGTNQQRATKCRRVVQAYFPVLSGSSNCWFFFSDYSYYLSIGFLCSLKVWKLMSAYDFLAYFKGSIISAIHCKLTSFLHMAFTISVLFSMGRDQLPLYIASSWGLEINLTLEMLLSYTLYLGWRILGNSSQLTNLVRYLYFIELPNTQKIKQINQNIKKRGIDWSITAPDCTIVKPQIWHLLDCLGHARRCQQLSGMYDCLDWALSSPNGLPIQPID